MIRFKTVIVIVCIVFAALTVFGGLLSAQTQQAPSPRSTTPSDRDPRMEQMIDMMFRDMDTNHDGRISESEWMAFQEKQFRNLDKNQDGFITKDEVRADMMQRMRTQQQQQQQQQRTTRPAQ